jgi:polysaccharide export outer membrane protein
MKKIIYVLLLLGTVSVAQEQKIKPGDAIEIVVYGHQELSRVVTVSPTGTIDFPFMQSLPVDGLTLERLREILVAQLSRYLDSYPVVTVNFSENLTIEVSVQGMIRKPGVVQLPLESTLQAAVAAAGGFIPGAKMNQVTLIRQKDEKSVQADFNLERFIMEGDMKQNPSVKDGDVILVTGNPVLSSVKVVGSVNDPGAYENYMGATVLDMILLAGGPSEKANLEKVQYISPSRKKSYEFRIDMEAYMRTADVYQFPVVKAGDIIVVPEKKNIWKGILSVARDVSTIALAAYYIVRLSD